MPPTSDDIQGLIQAAHSLIQVQNNTNERLGRLEVANENTQKAMQRLLESQCEMNKSMSSMSRSTIKMESEVTRIDEKMLTQITQLGKRLDGTNRKLDNIEARVKTIEIHNAGVVAAKHAEDKMRGWFADNWFNLGKLLLGISAAIGIALYVYHSWKVGGLPPSERGKP